MKSEIEIVWRATGDFRGGTYSRRHEWRFDGGARVPASSSPAIVPPPLSDAGAIDPEEALLASVASCHMLWFLDLARQEGLSVRAYADRPEGVLGRTGPGRMAMTRIILKPVVDYEGEAPSRERIAALHEAAHERCFIANSLTTEIAIDH